LIELDTKEERMSIRKSPKSWTAFGAVMIAVIILVPAVRAQKTGYAKICPFTMEIDPNCVLAKHLATKIEADNALLSAFLIQVRQKTTAEKNAQPVKSVPGDLTPASFAETYLKDPVLTKPDGTTIEHWGPIINFLTNAGGMIKESTYIDVQSVHATLEYVNNFVDVDFVAHVETVIAYAPYDAPCILSGETCHRKVCEWVAPPCPRGI
jgi:hypothetical protein